MPLSRSTKDFINQELHSRILAGIDPPFDYMINHGTFQPVLARIKLDGWIVEGWAQRGGSAVRNWWDSGVIQLRRSYRVRLTRAPEHQAIVEQRGEVARGNNTYLSVKTEIIQASLKARPSKSRSEVVDNITEALALAILHPAIRRQRPTAREGDLT